MEFLFFRADDTTLFTRADAESGNWAVQEMRLTALFPYDPGRVIERGMRVGFDDPGGGGFQFFEIRKVRTYEPDHYQEITAEHIAISELTDCHMQEMEISSATAASVLTTVLNGTGWSVGNDTSSGTSSADLSMGSVWQNICAIRENWNVIITPRITYNAGGITGRYLDIAPNEPVWSGVRLSINKNADEMGVTYDDTSLLTAMYGYGASRDDVESDDPEPVTFADVVWTATDDHPAKPSGQTYIEDPVATALYGRNGRPRFGFYQNSDIRDGATLLDKTWASLKNQNEPTVTIDCMVRDLYRLGYADQPIRVNDLAMIDIEPIGAHLQRTIIQMDVDLIDPTATRVTIGTYIPNIVYINHDVAERTGVGGRGSSNRSKDSETKEEAIRHEFEADINANNYQISLRAYQNDLDTTNDQLRQAEVDITANGVKITAAEGKILAHDTTLAEHQAAITTNATNISAEVTNRENADSTLSGRIDVQAKKIGLVVSETTGESGTTYSVNTASIILAINKSNGGTSTSQVAISADKVELTGGSSNIKLSDRVIVADSGYTIIKGQLSVTTGTGANEKTISLNNGKVTAISGFQVGSGGNLSFVGGENQLTKNISYNDVLSMIKSVSKTNGILTITRFNDTTETISAGDLADASVTNNVLTITKADGSRVNFSKATTVTGAWGSGGTYTVNATQTNINTTTGQPETTTVGTASTTVSLKSVSDPLTIHSAQSATAAHGWVYTVSGTVTIQGTTGEVDGQGNPEKVDVATGSFSGRDITSVYNDGWTAGNSAGSSTTLSGDWGSGGIYTVNASPQGETWTIKFGDTIGTEDATLNAVVGAGTPNETGTYITFPVNIGTVPTSGEMVTRVSLTRSVGCAAVRGMATSNALTVESQTDAQWADLTDVTDVSSSIVAGGKYLITATPKYGDAVKQKFIAPSGGGGGETINVSKGSWTSGGPTGWSSIVFSPSPASGSSVTLEIRGSLTEGSSNRTALWVRDRALTLPINGIQQYYTIQPNTARDYVELVNDSTGNVVARYAINDTSRMVTSLDPITLTEDHTSSKPYNVTVNYSDGTTGYSTITVDASAISGGGGSDDRTVTSLTPNPIVLTGSQTTTSSHTLTAHYSTGSDSTVSISVDASAVYAEGMSVGGDVDIQSGRVINITTNNTSNTYYATGAYDAMSSVIVNVNIPDTGGTITNITAPSIAGNQLVSNVTLTASGTNVAAPYTESVTLGKSTYNVGSFTKDCVTLTIDNNVVGRIATGYTKATVTLLSGSPTWITPAVTSSAFTLTGAGYKRLFYYSDNDGWVDAAVDGRTHYWYYSNSHVNTGDYAPMGTYTQYYPMSSVYTDTDTYYTKD